MKISRNIFIFLFVIAFSKNVFGNDSLFVFSNLNFKLRSSLGLAMQKQYPRESFNFKGCTEYDYVEDKDSNAYYSCELEIIDCRERLKDSSVVVCQNFFSKYKTYVCKTRYPTPDTTAKFRNMDAITGHGATVLVLPDGTKKQKYLYIDFMHDNIIYSITVIDNKKNVDASFQDFLNRFEFIE